MKSDGDGGEQTSGFIYSLKRLAGCPAETWGIFVGMIWHCIQGFCRCVSKRNQMSKDSGGERFYKCCINVPNPNPKEFELEDGKGRLWMCRSVVPIGNKSGKHPKEVRL